MVWWVVGFFGVIVDQKKKKTALANGANLCYSKYFNWTTTALTLVFLKGVRELSISLYLLDYRGKIQLSCYSAFSLHRI